MIKRHIPSLLTCASKSAWQVEYRPTSIDNTFNGMARVGVREGEDR